MLKILILNSNNCQLSGDRGVALSLFTEFKIRHPEQYHIRMRMRGNWWDGTVEYINKEGVFKIGLLPQVYEAAKKLTDEVKIIDKRPPIGVVPKVPKVVGGLTLRDRQVESLNKLLHNTVGGVPFLICAGDYSVNFGKTLLFCAIHEAFKRKKRTILLLNDSDLFNQFKGEIPNLLPGEDITFVRGGKVTNWGNFIVAMVPSLAQNLKTYADELNQCEITLIDEADIIDNKTWTSVITHLYNTQVRIGLSGTLYMSQLKKKIIHNTNIMQFIGPKVDEVKLIETIKAGTSTNVAIKGVIVDYPVDDWKKTYLEEFEDNVVNHKSAKEASYLRFKYNLKYKRLPAVIVTKYIAQCEGLYKFYQKKLGKKFRIAYVHHDVKNRKQIFEDFREGKIDILISTLIIARGKNLPTIQYLQNAASGKSQEKSIQILGRLVRKHVDKDKGFMDDLIYPGR